MSHMTCRYLLDPYDLYLTPMTTTWPPRPLPEAGVAAAGRRGDLAAGVRQLVQSLLDHHPDQPVRHELKVRPGRGLVPDDGLELLDLVGAGQDLELSPEVSDLFSGGHRHG